MPQDPESPEEEEIKEKKSTSQGKSNSKKETSKRDGKEKKDRGVTKFQESTSEGKPPPEDVFKKPLPPTVKKEESPPPVRLILILWTGMGGEGTPKPLSGFGPLILCIPSFRIPLECK